MYRRKKALFDCFCTLLPFLIFSLYLYCLPGCVDEEDGYQAIRKSVKEYRFSMKEYYKAAVDAFAAGDQGRASKLVEKGHFFHKRAREADEESAQKIFETRYVETKDEISLDLHNHGVKEALHLLKSHLSSLSGIASIKYLKVIVGTNNEGTPKGVCKWVVSKLLEKESIKRTEEGNGGAILIRIDEINRENLSFLQK